MSKVVIGMAGAAALAATLIGVGRQAQAQPAEVGTYDLLVPQELSLNLGADMVVFIGKSSGTVLLAGACSPTGAGLFVAQTAVVIDTGGKGTARISGILVDADVPNGTRFGSLGQNGTCTENGITYRKVRGTVL